MLRANVSKCQSNLENYLSILEFASYNSVKHVTIEFIPFMLMYGFQPNMVGLANEKIHQVKDFLQDYMDMLYVACQNV